jgi:hypothetical protein
MVPASIAIIYNEYEIIGMAWIGRSTHHHAVITGAVNHNGDGGRNLYRKLHRNDIILQLSRLITHMEWFLHQLPTYIGYVIIHIAWMGRWTHHHAGTS